MNWPARPRTGATPQTSGMPAPAQPAPQRQTESAYDRWRLQHAQDSANARRSQIEEYRRQRDEDVRRGQRGERMRHPAAAQGWHPVANSERQPARPGAISLPEGYAGALPDQPQMGGWFQGPGDGGASRPTAPLASLQQSAGAVPGAPGIDPAMLEALRRMMSGGEGEY